MRNIMADLKAHLLQLEQYHLKPEVRKNAKHMLPDLLAEDFFEIGSSGKFVYRQDCLVDEGIGEWDVTMSNFEIHPLCDEIVLTTYQVANHTLGRSTLRSSIWKFIESRWQMVFHQGTVEQAHNSSK